MLFRSFPCSCVDCSSPVQVGVGRVLDALHELVIGDHAVLVDVHPLDDAGHVRVVSLNSCGRRQFGLDPEIRDLLAETA